MELFAVCKFYLELQGRGPININWKETITLPPLKLVSTLKQNFLLKLFLKQSLKTTF